MDLLNCIGYCDTTMAGSRHQLHALRFRLYILFLIVIQVSAQIQNGAGNGNSVRDSTRVRTDSVRGTSRGLGGDSSRGLRGDTGRSLPPDPRGGADPVLSSIGADATRVLRAESTRSGLGAETLRVLQDLNGMNSRRNAMRGMRVDPSLGIRSDPTRGIRQGPRSNGMDMRGFRAGMDLRGMAARGVRPGMGRPGTPRMMPGAMRGLRSGIRQIPLPRRPDVRRQRLRIDPRALRQDPTRRFDPRTGGVVTMRPETRMRNTVVLNGNRMNMNPPLFTMCARPRTVRCYAWPASQDATFAYRCDGGCTNRECIVPCQCSCVDPRIISRLRASGRIRGRAFRPIDPRLWQSFEPISPRSRQSILPRNNRMNGGNRRGPTRPVDALRAAARNGSAFNFGISDDVLATLIAQPDLNNLVGPQGINQIIAGEPPMLLPSLPTRAEMRQSPPVNATVRQRIRTTMARRRPDANMGIPVPMNRIDMVPSTDPSITALLKKAEQQLLGDTTIPNLGLGTNLELPPPSSMARVTRRRAVTVEEIPGTRALFLELGRNEPRNSSSRAANSATRRSIAQTLNRIQRPSRSSFNKPLEPPASLLVNPLLSRNTSSTGSLRSSGSGNTNANNLKLMLEGTQPLQPLATDIQGRSPTKDECLAQQRELWCDPVGPWDVTPGVARWCILNCRSDNCDNTRCSCQCIDETLFRFRYEQISVRAP